MREAEDREQLKARNVALKKLEDAEGKLERFREQRTRLPFPETTIRATWYDDYRREYTVAARVPTDEALARIEAWLVAEVRRLTLEAGVAPAKGGE